MLKLWFHACDMKQLKIPSVVVIISREMCGIARAATLVIKTHVYTKVYPWFYP